MILLDVLLAIFTGMSVRIALRANKPIHSWLLVVTSGVLLVLASLIQKGII